MSLALSNVVNVTVGDVPLSEPQLALDQMLLLTSEFPAEFPSDSYAFFTSYEALVQVFGSASITAKAAAPFFSQSQRPNRLMVAEYDPLVTISANITAATALEEFWYGVAFADTIDFTDTDNAAELIAAADLVEALDFRTLFVRTAAIAHIEDVPENPFKVMHDKLLKNTVAFIVPTGDQYLEMAAASAMLSVNFQGTNTTRTMKFKTAPGVTPMVLTETQATKANAIGMNYYTKFGGSAMIAEGTSLGGRFFDEIHFLDWLIDAVQKNVFNGLYTAPNKIPLTDAGVTQLVGRVKEVARQGVRNGGMAPGTWRLDGFGALARGDYLEEGFYAWADSVANLSDTDVDARKAPTIYLAVKLAGAIHRSDVIIAFSR